MRIARTQLFKLVEDLPETVEIEDVLYRLALRKKLEAAEEDVREGRLLSEEEVAAEIAQWFSGLAGLAGGWEGSDELVERIAGGTGDAE